MCPYKRLKEKSLCKTALIRDEQEAETACQTISLHSTFFPLAICASISLQSPLPSSEDVSTDNVHPLYTPLTQWSLSEPARDSSQWPLLPSLKSLSPPMVYAGDRRASSSRYESQSIVETRLLATATAKWDSVVGLQRCSRFRLAEMRASSSIFYPYFPCPAQRNFL